MSFYKLEKGVFYIKLPFFNLSVMGELPLGKLLFGKMYIWEVATWKIVTWKVTLGKGKGFWERT